jgi:hypothetical protein
VYLGIDQQSGLVYEGIDGPLLPVVPRPLSGDRKSRHSDCHDRGSETAVAIDPKRSTLPFAGLPTLPSEMALPQRAGFPGSRAGLQKRHKESETKFRCAREIAPRISADAKTATAPTRNRRRGASASENAGRYVFRKERVIAAAPSRRETDSPPSWLPRSARLGYACQSDRSAVKIGSSTHFYRFFFRAADFLAPAGRDRAATFCPSRTRSPSTNTSSSRKTLDCQPG